MVRLRVLLGLVLGLFLASSLALPAGAQAAKPKAKTVLRAIGAAQRATPFSAGRAPARKAARAFRAGRRCAASSALATHHGRIVRRIARAARRGRKGRKALRRLRTADRRSAKARTLVLRSLPAGRGCGGAPTVAVDPALKPKGELPPLDGSGRRPVARIVDAGGTAIDFAANELVVTGTEAEVRALVKRWRGEVLSTVDTTKLGLKAKQFLVRIRTGRADEARLSADLAKLATGKGGAATVSSEQGLDLLAAAGREARRGTDVGVNFVTRGDAIAGGSTTEDPRGPDGFALGRSGWDPDAFNWKHLSARSTQGVGTAEAWQLLGRSGRSRNKVGLAVLDMGFSTQTNQPDFGEPLTAVSNVPHRDALNTPNLLGCGGGASCPWHGTNVANTAFSVVDDNHGVAGTGGPVARRIVVYTLYDFFTSMAAVAEANVLGARVVNMSYGAPVPYYLAWSVLPFEVVTRAARATGMTLIASAGNDNRNVDAKDCFLGACWEEAWWTPCENGGVMCVGALDHDSKNRASYSNWGDRGGGVDLFAPGKVLVGFDPATPTGRPGQTPVHAVQGTSFAAPYLAGVAALVRAADPGLGAGNVESILKSTAKASPDDKVRTYVDAQAAVRNALPPLVHIEAPITGQTLDRGPALALQAFVFDDGRGAPTSVTWTRADGTVIGSGASTSTTALGYGPQTIRVRAVLPGGTAVTDEVTITVANTPPQVQLRQPVNGASFYQGERVPLVGEGFDLNQDGGLLRDAQLQWSLDGSGPFALGRTPTLVLDGVSVGTHTLNLRGTDDAGASVTDTITITVGPAPPNLPPTVKITSPADNSHKPTCCTEPGPGGRSYAEFDFQADVTDPEGDPLTYTWTERVLPSGTAATRSTVEDPGTQRVYFGTCNDGPHEWTLTVSDGTSTRSASVRVGLDIIC